MTPSTDLHPYTPTALDTDMELRLRVLAEFWEMPGLRLTLTQSSRLFGIEPSRCEQVLGRLVEAGRLTTDGSIYAAADCGRKST